MARQSQLIKATNIENLPQELKSDYKNIYLSNVIDLDTGEVQNKQLRQIVDSPDDFYKLFAEKATMLANLKADAIKLFTIALTENSRVRIKSKSNNMIISTYNVIYDTTDFRKVLETYGMNKSRITPALKELVEKNIIIPLDEQGRIAFSIEKDHRKKAYLLNPLIIGKGDLSTIQQMKKTIIQFFDFEKLEFKEVVNIEQLHEGAKEVFSNIGNYEKIGHISNGNNEIFTIKETTPQPQAKTIDTVAVTQEPQALPAPQPQAKSDKEIELELTQAKAELEREQNRAKELEIELKKLEKMENSDLAQKIIDDNPLWFDQKRADVIDALGDRDRDENL